MADNTDEEHLDNPAINQSGNPPDEITPTADRVTINPNQETENMEVHHHPELHHMKKNFREYFFEFLMIFLAVTMGFFAENIRERVKNNEEIHEDIQSVLADLESDVAHFDVMLDMDTYGYTAADSLVSALHNDISNTAQIYFYARVATANVGHFYTNSKTFDLMKASGLLKLIQPRKLLDSLGLYYVTFQLLSEQDQALQAKNDAIHKGNHFLFDSYVFAHMNVVYDGFNRSHTVVQLPVGQPALLSTDYMAKNEVALNYYYLSSTEKFDCIAAKRQKQLAERLIEIIKQEYHLKNE